MIVELKKKMLSNQLVSTAPLRIIVSVKAYTLGDVT